MSNLHNKSCCMTTGYMCHDRPSEFQLDPKLTRKEMTQEDLMPGYDSASDYEYEEENVKVDKMGNTIEDDENVEQYLSNEES